MREVGDDNTPLVVAMAQHCRDMIKAWDEPVRDQPISLQLKHLVWMCDEIVGHAEVWPAIKIHRWIGFVQGGMIANGLIRLKHAKNMFDEIKENYTGSNADLLDHLNPDDEFELDIGGEG